jgi:hypothetical protein
MVVKLDTYLAARVILCLSPAISIRFMLSLFEAQIYAVSMSIITFPACLSSKKATLQCRIF